MAWYAAPGGKRGRNQVFSDAAIQCCLSLRSLFELPLRQCSGFVESLLKLMGFDWRAPDFSTLCRRQAHLQVQSPCRAKGVPLELLIDSAGVQFPGEGQCKRKTHAAAYRRQWRKVHLGIDAQTLEIRAVEVTDNSVGDAPMLPGLIGQILADEPIASVSVDGACDTWACHQAICPARRASDHSTARQCPVVALRCVGSARAQRGGGGVPALGP